jgi:hypothetical protein
LHNKKSLLEYHYSIKLKVLKGVEGVEPPLGGAAPKLLILQNLVFALLLVEPAG